VTGSASLPAGPGLLAALEFAPRPFAFLDRCAARWGDWFTLRFPGVVPLVFTSDPAAIRDAFAGDPDVLHAGEGNAPLGAFMGGSSVLFLDGASHLARRRLLLPAFHGDRMHAYGDAIAEIADRAIDAWPLGTPFRLHDGFREIAFEVILRTIFGFDHAVERQRLRALLARLFAIQRSPAGTLLGIPAFRVELAGLAPWGRVVRLRRELDRVLFAEIARRRARDGGDRSDVLSLLLAARDDGGRALSDEELRDELLTLVLAGHETTAAALAWVADALLDRRQVEERARTEVASLGDDRPSPALLPYLDAVAKEASRLAPVVPNVARVLKAPAALGGRELPAGVAIAPCIYLAHRRADLWPDPERFDPDRFLAARPAPPAFFPFGGGARRCIGAAFASHEIAVVAARMLARTRLERAPGYRARAVRSGIALAPARGLPVRLVARYPA